MKGLHTTIVLLLTWTIASCVPSISAPVPDTAILPPSENAEDINKSILLHSQTGLLQTDEPISLVLVNASSEVVTFPSDCNLQLFYKLGEEWIETTNQINFNTGEEFELPPFDDGGLIQLLLMPKIPQDIMPPIQLRVIVTGKIFGKFERSVYAYIDMVLDR